MPVADAIAVGDSPARRRSISRRRLKGQPGHPGPPRTQAHGHGKSKMNVLGHCMNRALSLAWGVWRNGTDFDPDRGSDSTRRYEGLI